MNNLINYHNEDNSLGIWLYNSFLYGNISYVDTSRLGIQGNRDGKECEAHEGSKLSLQNAYDKITNKKDKLLLLGHKLNLDKMAYCWYRYFGERH